MKKKNWIEFLRKTLIIFVMIIFSIFSTGFLVSIHECCHSHHHEVCKIHDHSEVESHVPLSELEHNEGCCENESVAYPIKTSHNKAEHIEGCSCDSHNHCLILTFLIKITDNFVVSDLLKNQLKSPTPIALFNQDLNNIENESLLGENAHEYIYSPPKIHLVGKTFIIFTSQRVYYA